jgi:ABC-type transporter Mla subunit MlaD
VKINKALGNGIAIAIVTVVVVVLALGSFRLVGGGMHEMQISFPSADGLVAGSDVLEAGAQVGTVSALEPTPSQGALVTIEVSDSHWPLHAGLVADIRPKSLLGEEYVDLHDGPHSGPVYDASAVLRAPANADPVELDQFINSLDPATRTAVRVLLDDLGAGVAAQGPSLNAALAAAKVDLANLAVTGTTLNDRDPDLDKILVGLDGVLGRITTNDELTQISQLIVNGQATLDDIESVQSPFSRQFTDAAVSLSELNTAVDGAVPSLRRTLSIAPALMANLEEETGLLAKLGASVTTTQNKSPHGECTASTVANQPITAVTGVVQCSPLWELIKGLLQGPTASGGGVGTTPTGANNAIFRVCIIGIPPQAGTGACDDSNASESGYRGLMSGGGTMLMSFLGT